jgi:coproporphyrinogen III oxidase
MYHTVYLFQVLTLDRGTTSGLLVHGDNDVGILGSLPSRVDRALLASWRDRVPEVQAPLVDALVEALEPGETSPVDVPAKRRLADAVRAHYRAHPEALQLQARGDVLPPTVANHR